MIDIPRLVVAAPASGSGKTTVATGLMAAFAAAGLTVSPHKAGPDYIDPGYHALAVAGSPGGGRPGRNLDAHMCGPGLIAPLFAHGAAGADVAVVEGVMGLYDGASGAGESGSTAELAKLLRAPVVLVVDASGQSRSVAALVHGFASWDPEVRIGGVVLNKVASDRHESLLRESLDAAGVPVLGALRRDPELAAPSRHLGLIPAAERRPAAVAAVRALAARVRESCDVPELLRLARTAPLLPADPWSAADAVAAAGQQGGPGAGGDRAAGAAPGARGRSPRSAPRAAGAGDAEGPGAGPRFREGAGSGNSPRPAGRPVVAMAAGPAFTFSYAEHAELLAAAGADVVPFDPLHDEALPPRTRALVIGGGFPEVYGAELAANEPLRRDVARRAAGGAPVAAECAGLVYLARDLDGAPMCGVLDARARMTGLLTLGYRDAVAVADSALAAAGTRVRGHEFHRTALDPPAGETPAWGMTQPVRRVEGFVRGGVHASYLHVHWAAAPAMARRLVEGCETA
ncbi:cobyrinic acid ac-diamide synthase [Streptomyces sp. CNQ-509]|uniref:cobyrinate a,c-diamide synthase n=1 Tax=unclassified Streptomyces TaxID=2593676 RepID=UPI00062DDD56|nr:cobyrinate a,c-diamide synthase [Streptomyces sp. CNQ-509]AKH81720.1 cobyrinic acid ac-diamide synthase [Streptomyces sp. CNQ-509]